MEKVSRNVMINKELPYFCSGRNDKGTGRYGR